MSWLVCPDSFKGTFGAPEVAEAIGRGLREAGEDATLLPAADGGEGTVEALLPVLGGELRKADVHDPLGREIEAGFAMLGDGRTAAVEVASASGLSLVDEGERDPEAASTAGTTMIPGWVAVGRCVSLRSVAAQASALTKAASAAAARWRVVSTEARAAGPSSGIEPSAARARLS